MFGFGSDNKDKLEDNMEQIKDLINEGETLGKERETGMDLDSTFGPEQEQTSGESSFTSREQSESSREQELNPPPAESTDTQSFSQTEETRSDQDLQDFEEEFGPPDSQAQREPGEQTPDQQHPRGQRNGDQAPQTREEHQEPPETETGTGPESRAEKLEEEPPEDDESSIDADIPSPPETREIDVPEIDKGPLFIRQRKFERASRMIEEMRYLTDQVEDTVNRIEGGVQEDQEIEKRVRELVHSFKEDRQEVQDIISPRQEREG